MILNGTVLTRDVKGNIVQRTLASAKDEADTLQVLSMNRHGHEAYSFALLDSIKAAETSAATYVVVAENSLGKRMEVHCTDKTQFYTRSKRWSGFVYPNKLRKNHILIDEEDRVCKLVSVERIAATDEPREAFEVEVKYNGNFFCNGLLVR